VHKFASRGLTAAALALVAANAQALELEIRRLDLDPSFRPGPP
jgi:hypothetical protein